ncbi:MAG: hypothetical protein LBV72_18045 [Tannerella sp.]|nr:hypothetical protein [Tannerella sp.]
MANHFAVWIDDLLGAVKDDASPNAIKLIESCGKGCASRQNVFEFMVKLRNDASHCKTRTDYVEFLNERLPVTFTETTDGIIMHLGKDKCGCKMATEITKNADALCNCTLGHEKATWSMFFGRPVDAEIVESFLRGGNDCVIKIIV